MSYWGATVITNLLIYIPSLIPWILGDYHTYNPTIYRYYIIHSILSVYVSGYLVFHVLYLHNISTSNIYVWTSNSRIQLYILIFYKDILFLVSNSINIYSIQLYDGIIMLSHPDNTMEVNILVTPIHILPEWYLLIYYTILKSIPNRSTGFLVMISYILDGNIHGEPYNTSSLIECTGYTGKYYLDTLLYILV
jgi:quinol-cytochrome oxidoreductase complex cytochrome b subunit